MQKQKQQVVGFSLGNTGEFFALMTRGHSVLVYSFGKGLVVSRIDESLSFYSEQQLWSETPAESREGLYDCDRLDFERRAACEKEVDRSLEQGTLDLCFDEEDQVLIYGCMMGVKVVNIASRKVICLMGKNESERFTKVALYQGKAMKNTKGQTGNQGVQKEVDPLVVCGAYKKNRFYLFSRREPEEAPAQGSNNLVLEKAGRDVFNEKPNKEDVQLSQLKKQQQRLGASAMI